MLQYEQTQGPIGPAKRNSLTVTYDLKSVGARLDGAVNLNDDVWKFGVSADGQNIIINSVKIPGYSVQTPGSAPIVPPTRDSIPTSPNLVSSVAYVQEAYSGSSLSRSKNVMVTDVVSPQLCTAIMCFSPPGTPCPIGGDFCLCQHTGNGFGVCLI